MEIHELLDKEFEIIFLNNLNLLQKNTDRYLNEIRKTKHEQNKKLNKEIETIKKEPNRNHGVEEYNDWTENSRDLQR